MLNKTSRPRNTALIACVLLALFCIALTFSNPVRLWTAKLYFGLENVWVEHWPSQSGRYAIKRLTPLLCDIGLLRPVRMKVDPGVSFLLDPRDLVSVTILRTKEWQPEVWDSLSPALAEGAVFLDVGAHIGYFSLKASEKVGETGRVVSFEPNPRTVPLLRDNVAVNHAQNVTVEPIACADRDQMLTLYAAASVNTGASSLSQKNADVSADQAPKGYAVRGRPIDDVVRELKLERVDAIKIDVEGAEVSVLRGAADTLKRFHPKVVTEMNPAQLASFNTTPEDVAALLRSAGYNHSKAVDDTDWEWTYLGANNSASVVRVADDATASQLLRGFHGVEYNAWRWTAADFSIAFRTPERADHNGAWVSLKLTVPEASLKKLGSITLSAKIGGAVVGSETFTTPGNHEFRAEAPASVFKKETTEVDFSLDKSLPPNATDPRQLGVIVTSGALVAK